MAASPGQLRPAKRPTGFTASLSPANTGFVVGDGGTILRTTDGSDTWTPLSSGLSRDPLCDFLRRCRRWNGRRRGGRSCGPPTSAPPGHRIRAARASTLFAVSLAPRPVARTAVGDLGTIVQTTDRGDTWKAQSRTRYLRHSQRGLLHRFEYRNRSRRERHDSAYQGRGRHVDASVQRHHEWLWGVSFKTPTTESWWVIRVQFSAPLTAAPLGQRQVERHSRQAQRISFTGADAGIVVGSGGTILRTTDGGATWSSQSSGTINCALRRILCGCQHRNGSRRRRHDPANHGRGRHVAHLNP